MDDDALRTEAVAFITPYLRAPVPSPAEGDRIERASLQRLIHAEDFERIRDETLRGGGRWRAWDAALREYLARCLRQTGAVPLPLAEIAADLMAPPKPGERSATRLKHSIEQRNSLLKMAVLMVLDRFPGLKPMRNDESHTTICACQIVAEASQAVGNGMGVNEATVVACWKDHAREAAALRGRKCP